MTPDPLEDFFARERARIQELPAGQDRWDAVVREARRPARRLWPAFAGMAAAAALAVAGYVAWHPQGGSGGQVAASGGTTATVTRTVTATGSPTSTPSSTPSTPTVLPAPVTFAAASFSNAGGGHLFSLGSARCGGASCVAVVGSDDDGRTWTTRSSFPGLVLPDGRRTPQDPNQLTGVRFASPQVGYAYGSKTYRTTDGGRTWRPFDVGGQPVLSLETDGRTVWLLTTSQCTHGRTADRGCSDLQVWSAPATATSARFVRALTLPRAVEAGWLSMDGSDAYVSVSFPDDTQALPQRVSGSPQQVARPKGCSTAGGVWVWGTAGSPGSLVALCRSTGAKPAYALAGSGDRGATWTAATPVPALGAPGYAGAWLTAPDADHLVALAAALPTSSTQADAPTSVWSSSDAGRHWVAAKVAPQSDTWWWGGAPDANQVYLLGGTPGGYALSTDSGATFTARPFRR